MSPSTTTRSTANFLKSRSPAARGSAGRPACVDQGTPVGGGTPALPQRRLAMPPWNPLQERHIELVVVGMT